MSITEDNVVVGETYQIIGGEYPCTLKIIHKSRFVFVKGAIAPYIEGIDEHFEKSESNKYPIYLAKSTDPFLNLVWICFRDYKTEELLDENMIAIYPDDEEYGHRVWCENDGIQKISRFLE
jgi:hypothetical protein